VLGQGVGDLPDAERVGERDRALQPAELLDLGRADQLAERVADVTAAGTFSRNRLPP
jgi:hypothetical protein